MLTHSNKKVCAHIDTGCCANCMYPMGYMITNNPKIAFSKFLNNVSRIVVKNGTSNVLTQALIGA